MFMEKKSDLNKKIRFFYFYLKNHNLYQPWVTVTGKLFTPSVHQAAKWIAALLRAARVTAGLAESNGSLPSGL